MTRVFGYLTALGCTSLVLLLFFWRAAEAGRTVALPPDLPAPRSAACSAAADPAAGPVGMHRVAGSARPERGREAAPT